jgi:hypothetical protein
VADDGPGRPDRTGSERRDDRGDLELFHLVRVEPVGERTADCKVVARQPQRPAALDRTRISLPGIPAAGVAGAESSSPRSRRPLIPWSRRLDPSHPRRSRDDRQPFRGREERTVLEAKDGPVDRPVAHLRNDRPGRGERARVLERPEPGGDPTAGEHARILGEGDQPAPGAVEPEPA